MEQMPNYFMLAISSGLVAGIITTLGNIIIAIFEKKSEQKLEAAKYANSINDYRYKELHKFLKVVLDHYQDEPDTLYKVICSNYERAKPLLSPDLAQNLDTKISHKNIRLAERSFIDTVQTQLERLILSQES